MKATITASIQYWEREALAVVGPVDEGAVVGEGEAEHVADDEGADLDVPDRVGAEDA